MYKLAMINCQSFSSDTVKEIANLIGDTYFGLTGRAIQTLLEEIRVVDISPNVTKWKRLYDALMNAQSKDGNGNSTIVLIERVMSPIKYVNDRSRFEERRQYLNKVLAFSGLGLNEKGVVEFASKVETIDELEAKFGKLIEELKRRDVHEDVLKYCSLEILQQNYFHAVFEATKGVSQRIRMLTGFSSDGAKLVDEAFSGESPVLKLSELLTPSDKSEQSGFINLLKGMFGFVRNPLAHSPKVYADMAAEDFLHFMTLVSLIQRTLDKVVRETPRLKPVARNK